MSEFGPVDADSLAATRAEALTKAIEAWDAVCLNPVLRKPHLAETRMRALGPPVNEMQDAYKQLAAVLGCGWLSLARRVASERRTGLTAAVAVKSAADALGRYPETKEQT